MQFAPPSLLRDFLKRTENIDLLARDTCNGNVWHALAGREPLQLQEYKDVYHTMMYIADRRRNELLALLAEQKSAPSGLTPADALALTPAALAARSENFAFLCMLEEERMPLRTSGDMWPLDWDVRHKRETNRRGPRELCQGPIWNISNNKCYVAAAVRAVFSVAHYRDVVRKSGGLLSELIDALHNGHGISATQLHEELQKVHIDGATIEGLQPSFAPGGLAAQLVSGLVSWLSAASGERHILAQPSAEPSRYVVAKQSANNEQSAPILMGRVADSHDKSHTLCIDETLLRAYIDPMLPPPALAVLVRFDENTRRRNLQAAFGSELLVPFAGIGYRVAAFVGDVTDETGHVLCFARPRAATPEIDFFLHDDHATRAADAAHLRDNVLKAQAVVLERVDVATPAAPRSLAHREPIATTEVLQAGVATRGTLWPMPANGPLRLRVYFTPDARRPAHVLDTILQLARVWCAFAFVELDRVYSAAEGDIRVAWNPPPGASGNSYVGAPSAQNKSEASMNLSIDSQTPLARVTRLAIHETGHALGLEVR